jgi:uncharacterized protein YyaL (SSP411 family)
MAATALLRLGKLTGRTDFIEAAGRTLAAAQSVMQRMPTAVGQMLIALDMWRGPMQELVIIGGSDNEANQTAVAAMQRAFLPNAVLAYRPVAAPPMKGSLEGLFAGRTAVGDQPTLYICENFACQAPVVGVEQIREAIAKL